MASELKVNTLTGVSTAGSIAVTGEGNSTTTNLQQGLVKAWINFDGSGTVSTNDSFNVSTLTDVTVGENTTTVTNAFGNAHSTSTSLGLRQTSSNYPAIASTDGTTTTTAVKIIHTLYDNSARADCDVMTHNFIGDLA